MAWIGTTYDGENASNQFDVQAWFQKAAFWAFVLVLAWAPFPLGSAVSWGSGILELLIAGCWLLWLIGHWKEPRGLLLEWQTIAIPLLIAAGVLLWVVVQTIPVVPNTWAHPIWAMTSDALGTPVAKTISIDPWRTGGELLKLLSYLAAALLAYGMGRRTELAMQLFNSLIFIAAGYAVYGFVLAFLGVAQAHLIYRLPFDATYVTGPFMLHNSFATYVGIATLAAVARLFHSGGEAVVANRGARQMWFSGINFIFGYGSLIVVATLLLFAAVIASASRGGFAATCSGLIAIALLAVLVTPRASSQIWPLIGLAAALLPLLILIFASGAQLGDRMTSLLDAGEADAIRLALWTAARNMIADSPWRGLGLGTFQDAYPLYARHVFVFVMDKAHCDYLEFAAGIGLPAAVAWWSSLAWLCISCLRGVLRRRRYRLFAVTAVGATVLVAVHSAVDFSLQIPAVALLYAALLGIGVAQSSSSRGQSTVPAPPGIGA